LESKTNKEGQDQIKIALWCGTDIAVLLNQLAKSFGLTRSALIRLILRQTLVNRGFLKQETESFLPKKASAEVIK